MKSFNMLFQDEKSLDEFITLHPIDEAKNLFVQIFSGVVDIDIFMKISRILKEKLPHANIIGTTTNGEIFDGEMLEEGVVLSFGVFKSSKVMSKLYKFDKTFNLEDIKNDLIFDDTKAMIIFSDGLKSDAETFLKSVCNLKPEMVIAGGRAGDKEFKQTYVFTEEELTDNGCVIATISSNDLIVNSDYIFQWTAVGREMEVTKTKDNVLYELDGIPIIDIYRKYLGEDVVKNMPASCMPFPLVLNKEVLLVARDPVGVTNDNGLIFGGKFEEGDKVRFSFANIEDLISNLDVYFEKFQSIPAEAVYVYSCVARKALLQNKLMDEINILNSLAPAVGFFTFGEFFHSRKIVELLNVTTTFMMLSESKKVLKKKLKKGALNHFDPIRKALTNLVKVTTQELENISTHDSLTSLYNRSEYKRILEKKIKSAQRYGDKFGLIMMDIDFFKRVNDKYGHNVGDEVLKIFASILKEYVREDDFVARWGGEEFIIIANHAGNKELEKLTKKLQKEIAKTSFAPAPQLCASFGLTAYIAGDTEESIFKRVDDALYMAKQTGRDKYIIS
ncbi:sensor domain-containing diguanylate cyclase [Sulfurimonas autotrophica]|uniref:diguanylate cyclase n=1 Tax=Sulfurimonas autotrophica (strain ATCC BAA-671 / DSM 16294 / JCM 11897 / OK10) TaxID=563040 RepID=E0URV4_SULAO|nr:diguanylate cyclase [Sulfurimonas autotrophica]ADN10118.1 diguanylate cyclase [Sulfurimonas autotrophica DSM 16294]